MPAGAELVGVQAPEGIEAANDKADDSLISRADQSPSPPLSPPQAHS